MIFFWVRGGTVSIGRQVPVRYRQAMTSVMRLIIEQVEFGGGDHAYRANLLIRAPMSYQKDRSFESPHLVTAERASISIESCVSKTSGHPELMSFSNGIGQVCQCELGKPEPCASFGALPGLAGGIRPGGQHRAPWHSVDRPVRPCARSERGPGRTEPW